MMNATNEHARDRIRVAFILPTLNVGGTEKHVLEVISRLDRQKFAPMLCCISGGGTLEQEISRFGLKATIFHENHAAQGTLSFLWQRAKRLFSLYRYFRQERPDLVHCYLYPAQIWGGLAAKLAGVPILITSRRVLGRYKQHRPELQWLENQVNRLTDMVIANSEAVREDTLRRERVCETRVRVIYNGVDTAKFTMTADVASLWRMKKRTALGIPPDAEVIGTIANLHPYKGHCELIQAVAALSPRFPNIALVCVGEDRGMQAKLERLAAELNVTRVYFTGLALSIEEWLPTFDIYVSASHEEGFSNSILEAMAAGLPIIATAVGGTPEAIRDQDTGLLVPPRNAEALTQALLTLLSDSVNAAQLASRAQKCAIQYFSTAKMISDMEDLYHELFTQQRGYLC